MSDPKDLYTYHSVTPFDPPKYWREITPDDNSELEVIPTCIRCSTDGNIAVQQADGVPTAVAMYFLAGVWHPLRPRRIFSTGTSAGTIWIGWS